MGRGRGGLEPGFAAAAGSTDAWPVASAPKPVSRAELRPSKFVCGSPNPGTSGCDRVWK